MKKSEVANRWLRLILLGMGCWLFSSVLFAIPGIGSLEWNLLDYWAVKHYGEDATQRSVSKNVAVVEIDEALFEDQKQEWPLDKNVYGELLDYLDTMGAKVAVFDLLFSENLSDCNKGDEIFRAMLGYFPNTVITFGGLIDENAEPPRMPLIPERYYMGAQVGDLTPMFGAILPYQELLDVSPYLAANNLKAMPDGIDRRVPLFVRDGNFLAAGMGYLGAAILQKDSLGKLPEWKWRVDQGCLLLDGNCLALDELGNLYPSFTDSIPEFNLSDLRVSQAVFFRGGTPKIGRKELENRVIYIGASAPSLGDLGSTPLSGLSRMGRTPNVLMHARTAEAILSGKAMRPWTNTDVRAISFMLVLLGALVYVVFAVRIGLVLNLAMIFLVPIVSYFAYGAGVYFPILEILFAQFLLFGCGLWIAFQERDRDHQFLESTFSTYLSKDVIKDMAKNREHPQLGGLEVQGTALFSDIQGFSTFSEMLTPNQLVSLLNEYFEAMTDVLLAHGATVDKFIGDAIVAFWGAPRACPDHAEKAVQAAVAMQNALELLRNKWQARMDIPGAVRNMRMRIGVNSGAFVVGNMGCSTRMHYTMMGDTVNLAARLESASGKYGVELLIGNETFKRIDPNRYNTRLLDRVRVKGRSTPEDIYEVLGEFDPERVSLCQSYESGLSLYFAGTFDQAFSRFQACMDLEKSQKGVNPSQSMRDRCSLLSQKTPSHWDGVWIWDAK